MNVNWFLGFLEGEGCFCITYTTKKYKSKQYRWNRGVFAITQIERDVLLEIQDFLAKEGIQTHLYEQFDAKARKHKLYRLHCADNDSLEKLVKLLDPLEWHTAKRQDFETFKSFILGDKANG